MFDYELPFHIQEEILKRLPVKSLVRFRSVSKTLKSLIDSSEFIAAHSRHRHTQQKHLLVSYEIFTDEKYYVSYIDDDTFPQEWSLPTLPLSVKQIMYSRIVGSSQGLVCLYGYHPNLGTAMAVLWNPSIRKSIVVDATGQPFFGFGVCPVTSDPKILSIKQSQDIPNTETSYHCKVMVYTLSSGKWKSLSNNLPTKSLRSLSHAVVSDRFIYWFARLPTHNMIMSFDVTNENFEMIDLPDSSARHNDDIYGFSQLKESLAIIEYMGDNRTVWLMEHGVQRSFTKLFTIETPHDIVGFAKSGVPIMRVTDHDDYGCELVVYEPNSQQDNVIESTSPPSLFSLNSYTETLLLLGRSDCTSDKRNDKSSTLGEEPNEEPNKEPNEVRPWKVYSRRKKAG